MIGHHTEKRREHQFAHPESLWSVEMVLQPVAVIAMGANHRAVRRNITAAHHDAQR
jgi:hypothetical protein